MHKFRFIISAVLAFAIQSHCVPQTDDADGASKDIKNHVSWIRRCALPDLRERVKTRETEIYRFCYNPSLGGKSLVLTLCCSTKQKKNELDFRRISSRNEVELTGKIIVEEGVAETFRQMFADPDVFDPLRSIPLKYRRSLFGLDGAWWTLETLKGGKYTFATLWCPEIHDPANEQKFVDGQNLGFKVPSFDKFVVACRGLLELSGLPLDTRDYYPFSPNLLMHDEKFR